MNIFLLSILISSSLLLNAVFRHNLKWLRWWEFSLKILAILLWDKKFVDRLTVCAFEWFSRNVKLRLSTIYAYRCHLLYKIKEGSVISSFEECSNLNKIGQKSLNYIIFFIDSKDDVSLFCFYMIFLRIVFCIFSTFLFSRIKPGWFFFLVSFSFAFNLKFYVICIIYILSVCVCVYI